MQDVEYKIEFNIKIDEKEYAKKFMVIDTNPEFLSIVSKSVCILARQCIETILIHRKITNVDDARIMSSQLIRQYAGK